MTGLFTYVEALVVGACLITVAYLSAAVARHTQRISAGVVGGGVLLLWFLLVWELARIGAFEGGRPGNRTALTAVMVAPLVLGLMVALGVGRKVVAAVLPLRSAIGIQAYRLSSITVVIAVGSEALPAWLGLPIGLGDLTVGITAPLIARALKDGSEGYGIVVRAWNWLGIGVAAFAMLATTAAGRNAGYFLTLYPLVLIPAFLAPASISLHAAATALSPPSRAS